MVPFDEQKTDEKNNPYENSGLIFADSIISNNSQFSGVIKRLLEKTLLVDDRKKALDLYPKLHSGWKVITTNGEVFDSRGTISAGTEYRVKPLKRKREKNVLESELDSSKNLSNEIEKEISENKLKSIDLIKQGKQNF